MIYFPTNSLNRCWRLCIIIIIDPISFSIVALACWNGSLSRDGAGCLVLATVYSAQLLLLFVLAVLLARGVGGWRS